LPATGEALIAFCKEHLATFKVPCLIKFRDEMPKLPTGKVLRRVLRDEARQLAPAAESRCKIRSVKHRGRKKQIS
jgi:acyl-CoA synthetase (AMP-forming)/AMP-acid ligase II